MRLIAGPLAGDRLIRGQHDVGRPQFAERARQLRALARLPVVQVQLEAVGRKVLHKLVLPRLEHRQRRDNERRPRDGDALAAAHQAKGVGHGAGAGARAGTTAAAIDLTVLANTKDALVAKGNVSTCVDVGVKVYPNCPDIGSIV